MVPSTRTANTFRTTNEMAMKYFQPVSILLLVLTFVQAEVTLQTINVRNTQSSNGINPTATINFASSVSQTPSAAVLATASPVLDSPILSQTASHQSNILTSTSFQGLISSSIQHQSEPTMELSLDQRPSALPTTSSSFHQATSPLAQTQTLVSMATLTQSSFTDSTSAAHPTVSRPSALSSSTLTSQMSSQVTTQQTTPAKLISSTEKLGTNEISSRSQRPTATEATSLKPETSQGTSGTTIESTEATKRTSKAAKTTPQQPYGTHSNVTDVELKTAEMKTTEVPLVPLVNGKVFHKNVLELDVNELFNVVTVISSDQPFSVITWMAQSDANFRKFLAEMLLDSENPTEIRSKQTTGRVAEKRSADPDTPPMEAIQEPFEAYYVMPTPSYHHQDFILSFFVKNKTNKGATVERRTILTVLRKNKDQFNEIIGGQMKVFMPGLYNELYTNEVPSSLSSTADVPQDYSTYIYAILFGVFFCLFINISAIIFLHCRHQRRKYRFNTFRPPVYHQSDIATELGLNLSSDLECTKHENCNKEDQTDRPNSRMYKMSEYQNWAKPLDDSSGDLEKTKC